MISPHWHGVCRPSDLLQDASVHADVNGVAICLVRNNGQDYAVHDECTHAEVPPFEGEVSNGTIECWLHGSRFDLATVRVDQDGQSRELTATVRIDTPAEAAYFRHGGILPYVLRQLLAD